MKTNDYLSWIFEPIGAKVFDASKSVGLSFGFN
jgi:hypothetical protein